MSVPVAQAFVLVVPVLLLLPPDLLVPQGDVPATQSTRFQPAARTVREPALPGASWGEQLTAASGWAFLQLLMELIHWQFVFLAGGLAFPTSVRGQEPILQEQPLLLKQSWNGSD